VHTHPKFSIAFAARGLELRPVSHEGSYFWPPGVPVFAEFTDLVRTSAQGDRVARALGHARAVFLHSHGVVVVGPTIAEACCSSVSDSTPHAYSASSYTPAGPSGSDFTPTRSPRTTAPRSRTRRRSSATRSCCRWSTCSS